VTATWFGSVAVTVTLVELRTAFVLMVNVPVDEPAAIVTDAGTVAAGELL
jgi:hypothetical protein